MSNIVLNVENIWKQYRLGTIGTGSINGDFSRLWAKLKGKEDPNLRIGEVNDRNNIQGEYVWALQNINFEVKQGEVLGIIGKNGAGKSTLLKILSKVTSPTIGQIKTKGRIASLLEVGTGFHPELTGRENIFLNGAILGMTKKDIRSKFDEIVDFSGVGVYIDTPVKRYSSGMYVRLAFAVAAHLEPEILIIDEVLAVGDAEFQKKCLGKMKDVSSEGRTVLFVSHQLDAVAGLCSKGLVMGYGKVDFQGNTEDAISFYTSKTITKNSQINNLEVHKNIFVEHFSVSPSIISAGKNINIDLKIKIENNLVISDVVLLFYRKSGERYAIIDVEKSKYKYAKNNLDLKFQVVNIPFIEGEYSIGIYLNCDIFVGDIFDLISFEIKNNDLLNNRPAKDKGFIKLNYTSEL